MLALKNPPSFLDLLLLGIVLASSLGSVVSDFATDRVGALGKGAHIGVVVAILAICVLSRGRWMRDPSALSLCEIRAKVRLAEEFLRHGGGAADAARQVGVPYAVLRAWRKQYGRASSEPGEE